MNKFSCILHMRRRKIKRNTEGILERDREFERIATSKSIGKIELIISKIIISIPHTKLQNRILNKKE